MFWLMDMSSDSMIDIQIQESLVRESLMTIDTANFTEDILTFGGFVLIVVLAVFTGIYGPPAAQVVQKEYELLQNRQKEVFTYDSPQISSLNRYISFSIMVRRKDIADDMTGHLSVGCGVLCKNDDIPVKQTPLFFESVPFQAKQKSRDSTEVRIYTERIITYSQVSLTLSIEGDLEKYSHIVIRCVTGDSDYTIFQIYFRLAFAIFVLLFVIGLYQKLRTIPVKFWHLEQKLTIPLLILDFIFCNPWYAVQAYRPTHRYVVMRTVANAGFTSYFHFFVLALFDSMRYKNRKTDRCFFTPKITFSVVQFLVSAFRGVSYDFISFGAAPFGGDKFDYALAQADAVLSAVYYLWVLWSIAVAAYQVDVTEQYKFHKYLATVSSSLLVLGIVRVLSGYFDLPSARSTYFTVSLAVQNALVMLMAHYHWPYEVYRDHRNLEFTEGTNLRLL